MLSDRAMNRNHFKSIVLYAAAGIGLLLVFVVLLLAIERRRIQVESGAVVSALFSQGVLHDMDKRGGGRPVEIVILRRPDCRMCSAGGTEFDRRFWFASLRLRWSNLSDAWFAQSSRTTRASFFLNSALPTHISTDLRLPGGARAVFVNRSDLVTKKSDPDASFPNNLGYFVVSHVGLNLEKTEALVYVDHFCGGLCGEGEYVLMRKVNGVWQIVDRNVTWVA
jgi:hypothetical protein